VYTSWNYACIHLVELCLSKPCNFISQERQLRWEEYEKLVLPLYVWLRDNTAQMLNLVMPTSPRELKVVRPAVLDIDKNNYNVIIITNVVIEWQRSVFSLAMKKFLVSSKLGQLFTFFPCRSICYIAK